MKIMIYDDDLGDIQSLQQLLATFFSTRSMEYEVIVCNDTAYLYKNIHAIDFLFLDIELHNENGIAIGLKLRQENVDMRIIITSKYSKYLIEGYKLQADMYFLKPIDPTEFSIEFETILRRYYKHYEGFFDEKICDHKLYYNDILYIEFWGRKTYIHLSSETIPTSYPLKYWEQKLQKHTFAKPHKSFIVNLQHLVKIVKTEIIFDNDEHLPLSRHYKKDFHHFYFMYLQGGSYIW